MSETTIRNGGEGGEDFRWGRGDVTDDSRIILAPTHIMPKSRWLRKESKITHCSTSSTSSTSSTNARIFESILRFSCLEKGIRSVYKAIRYAPSCTAV